MCLITQLKNILTQPLDLTVGGGLIVLVAGIVGALLVNSLMSKKES